MDNTKPEQKTQKKNQKMDIFKALQMIHDYHKNKALFNINKQTTINETNCVQRMIFILNIYAKWIQFKQENQNSNAIITNMRDIIVNELDLKYDLNAFLNDYRFCVYSNRNIFGYYNNNNLYGFTCNVSKCFILSRNNRNKKEMTTYGNKRNELFFVLNNNHNNNQDKHKEIPIQQILDTLHIWAVHSLRIKFDEYNINQIKSEEESEEKVDMQCMDKATINIGDIIRNATESSNRYRSVNESRSSSNNLKFVTTTQENKGILFKLDEKEEKKESLYDYENEIAMYQMAVYENNQLLLKQAKEKEKEKEKKKKKKEKAEIGDAECWLDTIFYDIKAHEFGHKLFYNFCQFIEKQEYETESIYNDLCVEQESNLFLTFNNNKLHQLFKSIRFEKQQKSKIYSAGFRFFYHSYYKKNGNKQWNILYKMDRGKVVVEGNAGFLIRDWVVYAKYINFKTELLNNKWSQFSLSQYCDILEKATIQLHNWVNDENAPPLQCEYTAHEECAWAEKMYGIQKGEQIRIHHIMALMFYCNFSAHSNTFSSTFRKTSPYETNEVLKTRQAEYYHWGKYLRECVECYGEMMDESDISTFFHGVSTELLFDSTTIKICGPFSTTANFTIAWSIFGAEGIVLDIKNTNSSAIFFNANYWTAFVNEDERLFIGGLDVLQFATIRNIPQQINFQPLIKVINILNEMLKGYALFDIKPLSRDVYILNTLITGEIECVYLQQLYTSETPLYITHLFHQFIRKKDEVNIDLDAFNKHFIEHDDDFDVDFYGYRKFSKIFVCGEDTETIKFSVFIRLLKKLKTLTVFNEPSAAKLENSINLSDGFECEIFKCIELINKKPASIFKAFQIVEPNDSINAFITKNKQKFTEKGWFVKQIEYENKERGFESKRTLLIQKM